MADQQSRAWTLEPSQRPSWSGKGQCAGKVKLGLGSQQVGSPPSLPPKPSLQQETLGACLAVSGWTCRGRTLWGPRLLPPLVSPTFSWVGSWGRGAGMRCLPCLGISGLCVFCDSLVARPQSSHLCSEWASSHSAPGPPPARSSLRACLCLCPRVS